MNPLSVAEIMQITGGSALPPIPDNTPLIKTICTDTRAMKPDSLFIAIKGENHDAHEKLQAAAAGGAVAALVERVPLSFPPDCPLILVASTRVAMGRLATHVRRQMKGTVIVIGGSNGKTSTKYLIHSVLQSNLRGSISPKSFNNDIGVPLAIFPAEPSDDYLVLEIGTNHPGEVRALSEMAQPDIAVITCISAEHLEGLGDIDGVRREEAGIIAGLNPPGTLIVNGDDEKFLDLISVFPGKKITFGFARHNDVVATHAECDEIGVRFRLNGQRRVFVPMLGRHVASNALAAIAVARDMGVTDDEIILALAQAHGPDMRLQIEKINGLTLLNDAYNANPASMRAALETVSNLPANGRRIAVIGDMRELGEHSARYHREAGEFAAHCNLDVLICVGDSAKQLADAARTSGMPNESVTQYDDITAAAKSIPWLLKTGDLVLFKASRSVALETVVKSCVAWASRPCDQE